MNAPHPLADRLALPILLLGAVSISARREGRAHDRRPCTGDVLDLRLHRASAAARRLLTEDRIVPSTLHGWLVVGGLAIVSQTIGQSLISWSLGHLPAAFSSVSLLLNPVASGTIAWMLLGEALTTVQIGGGLAVLFGIFVARPRPAVTAQDAPPPKPVAPST